MTNRFLHMVFLLGVVLSWATPLFAQVAVQDSTRIHCNGEYATVKYSANGGLSTGDNTIVAGVAGKRIRVIQWSVNCDADGAFTWESGTSTNIAGQFECLADTTVTEYCGPYGCFQTGSSALLNLALATTTADAKIVYIECGP